MICPLCNSKLPEPKIDIVEHIHPWVILPFYSLEQCTTKYKAKISKCSNKCGYMYCKILGEIKK